MKQNTLKKHLHECLQYEVMRNSQPFSWLRVFHKAIKCPGRRFNFWWRIASYHYRSGSKISLKFSRWINRRLCRKYGIDIGLGAVIGYGLKINHGFGIVIRDEAVIGNNLILRQNTTIGKKSRGQSAGSISIGDNVDIGASTCILGDISIGNNVIIGAMSFINKDIPDNCTAYTQKKNMLTVHESASPQ